MICSVESPGRPIGFLGLSAVFVPNIFPTYHKSGHSREEVTALFEKNAFYMGNSPGERLREAREEVGKKRGKKLTQRDVARHLEINEDTYRSYEYGKSELPENVARNVSTLLGKVWNWFYEGDPEVGAPATLVPSYAVSIPFIGSVGASSKFDWTDPLEAPETVLVPAEMAERPDRFACRALGDSCMPMIHPGDLLVFQKDDLAKLGSLIIHRSSDKRVTVKQLKHDGKAFFLHPLNGSYKDEPADGDCLGYMVGIIRESGTRRWTDYDRAGLRP